MVLQSSLCRGDPKLEAAAVSDPDHIVPGAKGAHVAKLQLALIQLDGAKLDQDGAYGPATAAAVLAYKQKRNIVNRSYQTQADNIVGKMTMAALDRELLDKEIVPSGPTFILPIFPLPSRLARPELFTPVRGFQNVRGVNGPVIDVALPTVPVPQMQLRTNEIGKITVVNGVGKRLVVRQSVNGLVFDPSKEENTQAGSVAITEIRQEFHVRGRDPGRTELVVIGAGPGALGQIGLILSVVPDVFTQVRVFFHFLDGPPGIKTVRTEADLGAILKTMNDVYQSQASMQFVQAGVNRSLKIQDLGAVAPGVRASQFGSTPDTVAIKKNQVASVLFNVFFFGRFLIPVNQQEGTQPDFLALTSTPPNDDKPLRCCLCRDRQRTDPATIDPGKTLAHEAGHALGEDDDFQNADSLMFHSQSGQSDTGITPTMSQRMLASFKKFPP